MNSANPLQFIARLVLVLGLVIAAAVPRAHGAGAQCGALFLDSALDADSSYIDANLHLLSPELIYELRRFEGDGVREPRGDIAEIRAGFVQLIKALKRMDLTGKPETGEQVGLAPEVFELLKANSRGIKSIHELMLETDLAGGYAVGLTRSGQISMSQELAAAFRLQPWLDAYRKFGISPVGMGHTELFMDAITTSGKPIVFFVPNEALTHPKAGVTREELRWLIQNPKQMENVIFVFNFSKNTEIDHAAAAAMVRPDSAVAHFVEVVRKRLLRGR